MGNSPVGKYHKQHLLHYTVYEKDSGFEQLDPWEIYAGKVIPVVPLYWLLAEFEA